MRSCPAWPNAAPLPCSITAIRYNSLICLFENWINPHRRSADVGARPEGPAAISEVLPAPEPQTSRVRCPPLLPLLGDHKSRSDRLMRAPIWWRAWEAIGLG